MYCINCIYIYKVYKWNRLGRHVALDSSRLPQNLAWLSCDCSHETTASHPSQRPRYLGFCSRIPKEATKTHASFFHPNDMLVRNVAIQTSWKKPVKLNFLDFFFQGLAASLFFFLFFLFDFVCLLWRFQLWGLEGFVLFDFDWLVFSRNYHQIWFVLPEWVFISG